MHENEEWFIFHFRIMVPSSRESMCSCIFEPYLVNRLMNWCQNISSAAVQLSGFFLTTLNSYKFIFWLLYFTFKVELCNFSRSIFIPVLLNNYLLYTYYVVKKNSINLCSVAFHRIIPRYVQMLIFTSFFFKKKEIFSKKEKKSIS